MSWDTLRDRTEVSFPFKWVSTSFKFSKLKPVWQVFMGFLIYVPWDFFFFFNPNLVGAAVGRNWFSHISFWIGREISVPSDWLAYLQKLSGRSGAWSNSGPVGRGEGSPDTVLPWCLFMVDLLAWQNVPSLCCPPSPTEIQHIDFLRFRDKARFVDTEVFNLIFYLN